MALSKYMRPRDTRMEGRNMAGTLRGGTLTPVKAVAVRESESGALSQSITLELDPIGGRMLSAITAEVFCVYVPAQAMDALKNPTGDYPGNAEVFRQKLLSGNPVFDLEDENEISKRCGVAPRSINGSKKVNEGIRLAHNAAVNHLRQRKYVKATQLDANSTAITPALLGQTVLDRLNAVLDPEDRVNGAVQLSMETIKLPVHGSWAVPSGVSGKALYVDSGDPNYGDLPSSNAVKAAAHIDSIWAEMAGADAGNVSLTDFYTAEKMDRLTREMRQLVDDNPVHGEELVARFAHGLSVDVGKEPFVIYERSGVFGMTPERAMDGPNLGMMQTNSVHQMNFTVPLPPTEFGGMVITFVSVKPDETLEHQPHPILSEPWGARNYVADELAMDPVPVTVRDLYADCDQADEETIVCYTGNNHLLRRYVNYGFNRHIDVTTVENKTAMWQIRVPMSVTPDSVIYPQDLDHYPFADQTAEVCRYNCQTRLRIATPIIFGPTPVEELAAIEDEDIFEDAPEV